MITALCIKDIYSGDLCDFRSGRTYTGEKLADGRFLLLANDGSMETFAAASFAAYFTTEWTEQEFTLPVEWKMRGEMTVKAVSLEEAIEKAYDSELPDGEYIPDSFTVDTESESIEVFALTKTDWRNYLSGQPVTVYRNNPGEYYNSAYVALKDIRSVTDTTYTIRRDFN